MPKSQWLRDHWLPKIKAEYDAEMKGLLKGRKIAVLTDETTNVKREAALIILYLLLPDEAHPEPMLVVAGVKILADCTGDLTSKALLQVSVGFGQYICKS